MASATEPGLVAVEEYLGACYKPDRDYVRGELQERNLGELEHSEMQLAVLLWFSAHGAAWSVQPLPEIRIQTRPGNFRSADVAVVAADAPRERILHTPPQIILEILSPEDRVHCYEERLEDYRQMGVPAIWVMDPIVCDPIHRIAYDCSSGSWLRTERLEIKSSGIYVAIPELSFPR